MFSKRMAYSLAIAVIGPDVPHKAALQQYMKLIKYIVLVFKPILA